MAVAIEVDVADSQPGTAVPLRVVPSVAVPVAVSVGGRARSGLLSPERRALTIGLVLVITLVAFEGLAVATVMPAAQRELGGLRYYGWTFSAFLLASVVGIVWAGEQCDRHGPARPLAAGLLLFAAGLIIAGCAPSMLVLVAGRAVQGLGAGVVPSVAYVAIGRGYDASMRSRMFAVLASAWVVPGLIGPVIAGAVADYASWRLVFLALLPLIAIAAALVLPALRRLGAPDAAAASSSRTVAAALLAFGVGLALAGLAVASPGVAVAVVVAGVVVSIAALRTLVPREVLRGSGIGAAIVGNGLVNMAFFGTEAFVPLTITTLRHQSTLVAGVALTAATISWTAGAWIRERMDDRVERRTILRVGVSLVAVGIAAAALALWPAAPIVVVACGWGIAGLGIGLVYSTFSLIVLEAAPEGQEGLTSSSHKLAEVLSTAIGIGIGGAVVSAGAAGGWERMGVGAVFGVMFVAAVAAVVVAGRVRV